MRVGFNPNKDKIQNLNDFFHQVIIPVYIPNNEGYFKDSFTIFKYCLESLFITTHDKTYFTVINNGSSKEVVDYLNLLHQENKLHEVIHTSNIGKINAVLKGITGQKFKLITIADADAMFLHNWQNETYKVFNAFKQAGAVCPTASSKSFNNNTANLIFDKFFSESLKFTPVKNPEALKSFAHSIGNPNFYTQTHLKKYLTISGQNIKAVVGAGHFAATYRFDIFSNIGVSFSDYSLGGNSEDEILDKSVVKKGFWRLSTEDNFVYHMGNIEEDWMLKELHNLKTSTRPQVKEIILKNHKSNKMVLWIKNHLFSRIIFRKKILKKFLQYKGLTKEESGFY